MCRLELLFAHDKVREAGQKRWWLMRRRMDLTIEETRRRVEQFDPDFLVIPSAPSYLFWRCPPPEVRVPKQWFAGIGGRAKKVLIGPHASATPVSAMRKTGADVAIKGEPDQAIADLASKPWKIDRRSVLARRKGETHQPMAGGVDMKTVRALDFDNYDVEAHWHRHHVFSGEGRGAELEFARGCPWACTFCNKTLIQE